MLCVGVPCAWGLILGVGEKSVLGRFPPLNFVCLFVDALTYVLVQLIAGFHSIGGGPNSGHW